MQLVYTVPACNVAANLKFVLWTSAVAIAPVLLTRSDLIHPLLAYVIGLNNRMYYYAIIHLLYLKSIAGKNLIVERSVQIVRVMILIRLITLITLMVILIMILISLLTVTMCSKCIVTVQIINKSHINSSYIFYLSAIFIDGYINAGINFETSLRI